MEYEGERWALSLGWERGVLGVGIEGDHDRVFGSVSVTGLLLGLRFRASYTYDSDTPLLRDLRGRMDELRSQAFVTMRADEYDALKADADRWREVPAGGGTPIHPGQSIQFHEDPWPGREHAP